MAPRCLIDRFGIGGELFPEPIKVSCSISSSAGFCSSMRASPLSHGSKSFSASSAGIPTKAFVGIRLMTFAMKKRGSDRGFLLVFE